MLDIIEHIKSCLEYKNYGKSVYPYLNSDSDGVYKIDPDGRDGLDPFEVYCDMTTDGGGWTHNENQFIK